MRLEKFDINAKDNYGDFFLLSQFEVDVQSGCISDYDGFGEIIYLDTKAQLWIDEDSSILDDGIDFEGKGHNEYTEYYPVAVLWHNK